MSGLSGWMDGWMAGWLDGWVGQTDGLILFVQFVRFWAFCRWDVCAGKISSHPKKSLKFSLWQFAGASFSRGRDG